MTDTSAHPDDHLATSVALDAVIARSALVVPDAWTPLMRAYDLSDGMAVSGMNGKPGKSWEFQVVGQPSFCIAILLEGRMRCAFEGGTPLDVQPGMAVVTSLQQSARAWHVLDGSKTLKLVNISIAPETFQQLTGLPQPPQQCRLIRDGSLPQEAAFMGCLPASTGLQRIAHDMLMLDFPTDPLHKLYLRAKTQEAVALMTRNLISDSQPIWIPADRRRLMEAKNLLENQYGQDWTVPALARTVGLNEKRLQAGFQTLYGQPIHAFLVEIRMNAAAKMLDSGVSVTETAYSVGYSSLSHFSKVFRQYHGVTPKRWSLKNG